MKVLFFSNWIDNPYKDLLSAAIAKHGAEVDELQQRGNFFLFDVLKSRPDVFHMHLLRELMAADTSLKRYLKFVLLVFQLFVLKLTGISIAWTVHDWEDKLGLGKDEIDRWKCRILNRLIDTIIVHCDSTADIIRESFGLENSTKVHVIPHGNYFGCYPEKLNRAQAREKLGIPSTSLVFLLFGGVHRYKGISEMIDAVERVDADIAVVIAGKIGDPSLGVELVEKSKTSDKVYFFPGLIDDDVVHDYFSAADCVAMPYQVYTTSGVALLAISFSRVCLAPRIGFFNDILDDEGTFFYNSDSSDGLRDAIAEIVENQDKLEEMEANNYNLASKFDWDTVGLNTWNALNKS